MISYSEQGHGNGPALIFVHAYPLDRLMWQNQTQFFSARHWVITPDVFGFGGSQPPLSWIVSDMSVALLDMMDHLRIEKCTLIGLSMGGYISIPFALSHPDRVERLVLAHTRARSDTVAEKSARNNMIEALRKDGTATLVDKMLPRLLAANASSESRQFVKASILRSSATACIYAVAAMRDRDDHSEKLGSLACPTLVITGDSDPIVKIEDSRSMAAAIPNAQLSVIAGTAHLSNLENPSAFNQALDAFLKRSDSK